MVTVMTRAARTEMTRGYASLVAGSRLVSGTRFAEEQPKPGFESGHIVANLDTCVW